MRNRLWEWLERWRGVALAGVATVTTVWLAVSGKLILYIHPRYVVFTVIMALIALVVLLVSVLARKPHDHDETTARRPWLSALALLASVVVAAGMIVVPPATLTASTAVQRDITDSAVTDAQPVSATASTAKFTVRDWASLLRQTSDVGFYANKPVAVTGFVTADAKDPDNLFYVSRFVITCCAVDAQPVGVPVYQPGWSSNYKANAWVAVAGTFGANPSASSSVPIVLVPTQISSVKQPDDPYLF